MTAKTYNIFAVLGIAASWAKQNLPGWTDDSHRDLLARHGATAVKGRMSAKTLSASGIEAALSDYEQRGWPRQRRQGLPQATRRVVSLDKQSGMIRALWIQLGKAGALEADTAAALLAFCRSMSKTAALAKVEDMNWAQKSAVIEALKNWQVRKSI